MNSPKYIQVELLSDAAFGRGEGTAGEVDVEVEHDDLGLPFLGGKTLRGLLRDSWLALQNCFMDEFQDFERTRRRIFGPTADFDESSILRVGDATIEETVRDWIFAAEHRPQNQHPLPTGAVLAALTDIRRQTEESRQTGAPEKTTLRSIRVVIRGLKLEAPLDWIRAPEPDDLRCLALALLATRHAGRCRNRGCGHIRLCLEGDLAGTRQAAKGGL